MAAPYAIVALHKKIVATENCSEPASAKFYGVRTCILNQNQNANFKIAEDFYA